MGSEGEGGTPKPTALRTARGRSETDRSKADRDYRPETVVRALLIPACRSGSAPFETKLGLGQLERKCAPSRSASEAPALTTGPPTRSNRPLAVYDGALHPERRDRPRASQ